MGEGTGIQKQKRGVQGDTRITQGVGRVLTFGTFDLFHMGHYSYLSQASQFGDALWVLVACDASVLRIKKSPPLQDEQERLLCIRSLPMVRGAFLGGVVRTKEDYLSSIYALQPSCVCFGYDQALSLSGWLWGEIERCRFVSRVVRLDAFFPQKYKTSLLRHVF